MSFSPGGVLREPLDGEPGARGERPPRRPAGVDRAVVEHEDHRPADPTRRRTVLPAKPPQQVHEVAGPLGAPPVVTISSPRAWSSRPRSARRPARPLDPQVGPALGPGVGDVGVAAAVPPASPVVEPRPFRRLAGAQPAPALARHPGGPRRPPGPRAGYGARSISAWPLPPAWSRKAPIRQVSTRGPPCRNTAAARPPTSSPSSRARSRPAPAPPRGRRGARRRTSAGRRGPRPRPGAPGPGSPAPRPARGRPRLPPARSPPEPRREPSRQPVQAARPPLGFARVRQARPSSRAERPNRGCGSGAF